MTKTGSKATNAETRTAGVLRARYLLLVSLVIGVIAVWTFVSHKRHQDYTMFQLCETARVLAAYLSRSHGAWPQSIHDLEAAGVARVLSSHEFAGATEDTFDAIPQWGPTGITMDTRQIRIGWGGIPLDKTGRLLDVAGEPEFNQHATLLSRRLRGFAENAASQPVSEISGTATE